MIFLGVSAAFLVENYRQKENDKAEMMQAVAGIIKELEHYETKSVTFADRFQSAIDRWSAADKAGKRAAPGYFRIPGAPHPPSAAWNATVTSGIARMLDPQLRIDLGYFYNEFVGIHDSYDRYNQFTEREILPRISQGPDAFYGADGKVLPIFRVHMDLQAEFAANLRRLAKDSHDLRLRLEALSASQ